jgi:hypothetical protein
LGKPERAAVWGDCGARMGAEGRRAGPGAKRDRILMDRIRPQWEAGTVSQVLGRSRTGCQA